MNPVIDLLRDLVAIPSVNPYDGPSGPLHGEAAVAAYVAEWLTAQGIPHEVREVRPGRPNVLAHMAGGDGPSVLLEAHMDTVSVDGMAGDPFSAELVEGRVHGRGACDCKASLAAMLIALAETARRGTPPGDVWLAATADEEFSGSGAQRLMDEGLRADGAVVGEPTGLRLVVAHKGAIRCRVTTRGRSAHSSEPDRGDNAIYRMVPVLQAIEDYGRWLATRPPHPLVGLPTVSVGVIRGGQAPNVVPDECEIVIDRRLLPTDDPHAVEAELRQWLADRVPNAWEMTAMVYGYGMATPPDAPIIARCSTALGAALGSYELAGAQYGTDASRFSRAGIPTVVLGPGDIRRAHTADEWVEVAQVEQAVAVYRGVMWPEGQ